MHLVRRAHPPAGLTRSGEPLEVIVLPLLARKLGPPVIDRAMRDGEDGVENTRPELVTDALLEHATRVILANAILDHIVKNAGDYRILIAPIPRQDNRHIRGLCQVRQPRPLAYLPVMMLGGERKCVVDSI